MLAALQVVRAERARLAQDVLGREAANRSLRLQGAALAAEVNRLQSLADMPRELRNSSADAKAAERVVQLVCGRRPRGPGPVPEPPLDSRQGLSLTLGYSGEPDASP